MAVSDYLTCTKTAPTVAEMAAERAGKPLPKSEMLRAEAFKSAERDEKKLEEACKRIVWKRDKGECRHCETKVVKSLAYQPKRGETHHIIGRAFQLLRFDPRNRMLVCAACHERIEKCLLFIVGTARQMFTAEDGKSYLNADCKLRFTEKKPA
jgi:hypothetical protein